MKKKILIISGLQVFPPESGGQTRTASIAETLADLGNIVKIYSFTGRRNDYLTGRRSDWINIASNLSEYINRNPLFGLIQYLFYFFNLPPVWLTFISRFHIPRILKNLYTDSDHVIIDFPYLYFVGIKSKHKFILNTHNVESKLWSGSTFITQLSENIAARIECHAIKSASCSVFCTTEDAYYFKQQSELSAITAKIIPNALNLTKIKNDLSNSARQSIRAVLGVNPDIHLILFSGSAYFANIEAFQFIRTFCHDYKNLLRKLSIKFLIVGSVADEVSNTEFYYTTSKVDNVHQYFTACDAAINPMVSGSGSNIKMSEYIAFKLPIFTTYFGSRGFNLQDQVSCFYFDLHNLDRVFRNAFENNMINQSSSMATQAYQDNLKMIDMKENILSANLFSREVNL